MPKEAPSFRTKNEQELAPKNNNGRRLRVMDGGLNKPLGGVLEKRQTALKKELEERTIKEKYHAARAAERKAQEPERRKNELLLHKIKSAENEALFEEKMRQRREKEAQERLTDVKEMAAKEMNRLDEKALRKFEEDQKMKADAEEKMKAKEKQWEAEKKQWTETRKRKEGEQLAKKRKEAEQLAKKQKEEEEERAVAETVGAIHRRIKTSPNIIKKRIQDRLEYKEKKLASQVDYFENEIELKTGKSPAEMEMESASFLGKMKGFFRSLVRPQEITDLLQNWKEAQAKWLEAKKDLEHLDKYHPTANDRKWYDKLVEKESRVIGAELAKGSHHKGQRMDEAAAEETFFAKGEAMSQQNEARQRIVDEMGDMTDEELAEKLSRDKKKGGRGPEKTAIVDNPLLKKPKRSDERKAA